MKGLIVLIVLIVVVGVGLWSVYHFGGFTEWNPKAQAEAFHQKVKAGMTWSQVADVSEPRKLYPLDHHTINGERQPVRFDRKHLVKALHRNAYPEGFAFKYRFTHADAYQVIFDSKGKALGVSDLITTHDLLSGNAFSPSRR